MTNNVNAVIQVSFISESEAAYGCLVKLRFDSSGKYVSGSELKWFPKKLCTLEKRKAINPYDTFQAYFITCPKWLLDKNKIPYV